MYKERIKKEISKIKENKIYQKIIQITILLLLVYFLVVYSFILAKKVTPSLLFGVISCCLFISIIKFNDPLIILGEIFTLVSDIFLILLGNVEIGMTIFWLAHIAYGLYFYFRDSNILRRNILASSRLLLMIILLISAKLFTKEKFNIVVAFSMIYYANIIVNLLHAILLKDWLLVVAFSLFILCDTTIGLINILPNDSAFRNFLESNNFTHLFYMPSQVLIVLNKNNNKYQKDIRNKRIA